MRFLTHDIKKIFSCFVFTSSAIFAEDCYYSTSDENAQLVIEEVSQNLILDTGGSSYSPEYAWGPLNPTEDEAAHAKLYGLPGVWLSENPPLFRPFMADPRQITYSVGWRFNDRVIAKNGIDVSFDDSIQIYRWFNVWPYGGELQIEIQGALWACFDPLTYSAPLVNADYYVGFPISYAVGPWSFRLRGFHISSHIGDEFLLNHPGFDRRNPSAEYLDFSISYELTKDIRIYDVIGYILHDDPSFKCKRLYIEAGMELRLRELGFVDYGNKIYGEPIYGMHYRWNGNFKNHVDMTYILGYEFGKLSGLRRKLRFFIEYHDGYSVEGQFARCATNYFSIRATYGY